MPPVVAFLGYDSGYTNGVLWMKESKNGFGHGGWVDAMEAYKGYLYESGQIFVITSILSAGSKNSGSKTFPVL
jgi:hypothetical protein